MIFFFKLTCRMTDEIRTVTSGIRKFPFIGFRLLDYSLFEGPPLLMFARIGFDFIGTSKEKQNVILQRKYDPGREGENFISIQNLHVKLNSVK